MSDALTDQQLMGLWAARQERAALMRRLRENEEDMALALEYGRRDPVYWIETFASTYDPRLAAFEINPWVPFSLYPRQKEYVRWAIGLYRRGKSGATPKCRGVGASWIWMGIISWLVGTRSDMSISVGSHVEVYVDQKGSLKALMPKISGIIDHLPDFARDFYFPGWDSSIHHTHRLIVHPSNGSVVNGEVGKRMGRGGRSALFFWDEAAHHDFATEVDNALSMNTDCLMEVSTPKGTDNPFAQKVLKNTVPCFYLRHDTVPHYDAEWLERMRTGKYGHNPVGFAQEILVDFEGSGEARLISAPWVQYALNSFQPDGVCDDSVTFGVDVATTSDRVVLVARRGADVFRVESMPGAPGFKTGRWVWGLGLEMGVHTICYDAIGVGEGLATYLRMMIEQTGHRIKLVPVVSSARPTRTFWRGPKKRADELFTNLRAELWFTLRERFRIMDPTQFAPDGASGIRLVAHEALREELGWIRQKSATGGKLGIERKDDLRARQGSSPDHADALMMAFADDVLRSLDLQMPTREDLSHDYHP